MFFNNFYILHAIRFFLELCFKLCNFANAKIKLLASNILKKVTVIGGPCIRFVCKAVLSRCVTISNFFFALNTTSALPLKSASG